VSNQSNLTTGDRKPASVANVTVDFDNIHFGDLVAPIAQPTRDQIEAGVRAIDVFYDGTKDAEIEDCVAYVYRAMKALELARPTDGGITSGDEQNNEEVVVPK
jgi:hypothetical protein